MFKIGDRVRRSNGKGAFGIVIELKQEVWGDAKSRLENILIKVQWDNGTASLFAKESLQLVDEINTLIQ